ncbi:MAG TPA: DUF6220 domain-containing protein [Candidatus Limnocylindria bacterium]|jgi:hypothetical protein|nr:DUF6220 domain-containing protein [Candidatus Limnocylindria bacterium]
MQTARYLFAASAVLFVLGVVAQIFIAGFGLPGLGGQGMRTHVDFGYTLSLVPIVPLVLAWPAKAGRGTILMCAALLVLTFVQTLLPLARNGTPWVSALHPVNAFLVLGLGISVARRAVALARTAPAPSPMADDPASAAPQA